MLEGCNDIILTDPENPNSFSSSFLFVFICNCSLRSVCFDYFFETGSVHSPGCHGPPCIDKAGLSYILRDLPECFDQ